MKKILLITLLLLLSTSYATFTDMPENHWAYNAVSKMEKNEILSGYPDGSFKPAKNITVAEFSTIFTKFFGISSNTKSNFFTDVPSNHWAKGNIEAVRRYIDPNYNSVAESLNYYDYFSDAGINADMPVTREIVIYALYNIFGYDESLYSEGEEKELFTDYEEILFPKAVCIAYKNGVISGEEADGNVYIRPQRYITRAEISAMFNNLLGYNDEIINHEGFDVLEEALNKALKTIESKKINESTKYLYDTLGIFEEIDFSEVVNDNLLKIIKMWHDNFSYEVREHGFYSYNHAYLVIDTFRLEMDEFIDSFELEYKDFTTEKLKEKIDNYDFRKSERFSKNRETITIEFIKVNNEWKIKL